MHHYKDRHGIPGDEVTNLTKRYYGLDGKGNWENFDAFVLWCSQNGYQKGLMLRRHDKEAPHSPENSYFSENTREQIRVNSEKFKKVRDIKSPFCEGCEKECPRNGSGGCDEWQDYFTKNWNQNICIAPSKTEPKPAADPNVAHVWRYEHPDLVREGIVFHG